MSTEICAGHGLRHGRHACVSLSGDDMSLLLEPPAIARLLYGVTATMLNLEFRLTDGRPARGAIWRTVVISIPGERPVALALSSTRSGCAALGTGAVFSCGAEELDREMEDDALAELTNVAAGEVKRVLRLDQLIGLPHVFAAGELATGANSGGWESVLLTCASRRGRSVYGGIRRDGRGPCTSPSGAAMSPDLGW